MFVVGGLCLLAYCFYEIRYSTFPSSPRRLLFNRTFFTACVINVFYMMSSYMNLLYLSSYTYIVKDWSDDNWTCESTSLSLLSEDLKLTHLFSTDYNNTLSISLW